MRWIYWSLLPALLPAQPESIQIYSGRGKPATYKALLIRATKADVIFFGELHNSEAAHAMQKKLLEDLIRARNGKILLGMEMFERDQQGVLLAYQRGEIATPQALAEKTRVWPNFISDYAPLLEMARRHGVPVYATNAPREIVQAVAQQGLSVLAGLPPAHRGWIAPLPLHPLDSLPSYQAMAEMSHAHGLSPEYFRLAQMLKDATMAYAILQGYQPGHTFLHINGSYHSDYGEGIVAYLRHYWGPKIARQKKVLIVSTVALGEGEIYLPEARWRADFILVVRPTAVSQMP